MHLIASDQIASDLRLLANVVHLIASDRIVALDCDYCERNICKGFVLDCEENIPSDSRTYVYLQESHIYFHMANQIDQSPNQFLFVFSQTNCLLIQTNSLKLQICMQTNS